MAAQTFMDCGVGDLISGNTTLLVGLELNADYVELARQRLIADAPLINSVAEVAV